MDYIKQIEILRERNAKLSDENEKLKQEVDELKQQLQSSEDIAEMNELKDILNGLIAQHEELVKSLKNIEIEYQIKYNNLKTILTGFNHIKEEIENSEANMKGSGMKIPIIK